MSARMITGFNSDIEHGGKVFHVQTEEKGLDNPIVITLVYCGGEIVTSHEASYADLVGDDPAPEGEVRRRMSAQHQRLIQQILRGRFSPTQMPYGHDLISDRSLDELVLNYLEDEITERTAKVGRVLTKLERFLSAAEQAKAEPEAPAEPATVEDDPVDQNIETVDAVEIESTPDVAIEVAAPTPERRRRKTGWIWAAMAAAIVVGVAGLYVIRSLGQGPSTGSVAVPTPAPAIESSREAVEPGADVIAGVSVSTEAPAPAAEEVPDEPTEAVPVTPRIPPVVDDPVAESRPTVVAEQSDPVIEQPRPEPEPEPEPEPSATIPVEADAQAVIDEPIVEDEPIAAGEPNSAEEPIQTPQDVDVSPMASQRDLPRYTRRARRLQQEGIVRLRILIGSHGEVADAELLSGIPDSDLNQAALEVTRDWTFSPARKEGQRVEVWKEVAFEFSVRPDRTTSVRIRE